MTPQSPELVALVALACVLVAAAVWSSHRRVAPPAVGAVKVRASHVLTLRTPHQTSYQITVANTTRGEALEVAQGIARLCYEQHPDELAFVLVADQLLVRAADVRAIAVEPVREPA